MLSTIHFNRKVLALAISTTYLSLNTAFAAGSCGTPDASGDIRVDSSVSGQCVVDDSSHSLAITSGSGEITNSTSPAVVVTAGDAISLDTSAEITGDIEISGTLGELSVGTLSAITGDIYVTSTGSLTDGLFWNDSAHTGDIYVSTGAEIDGNGGKAIGYREGAVVVGNIENYGTITTDDSTTIFLSLDSTFTGNIVNHEGAEISDTDGGIAIEIDDASLTGNIDNAGAISGGEGIVLYAANVDGDIINRSSGTIEASGTGDNTSAIEVNNTIVTGAINNYGSIKIVDGDNGITVWGDGSAGNTGKVLGGIFNYGTILSGGEGLDIDDAATIDNGIYNSGSIISTGSQAIEIDEDTVVSGGIINTATGIIRATGSSQHAIEIDGDATLNGGIINDGVIDSSDARTVEVDAGGTINDGIVNQLPGRMVADSDILFVGEDSTVTGGFTNLGVISAGDDFIHLDEDSSSLTGGVHNYGTVIAADDLMDTESGTTFTGGIFNYEGAVMAGELSFDIAAGTTFTNSGLLVLKDQDVVHGRERSTGTIVDNDLIGTYTQTSTGTLNLGVDDGDLAAGTGYSNLTVDGDVNLSDSANIDLDVKNSGDNIANGEAFENVISATGTLTTSTFNVTDNSLALSFTALNDGSGGIDLTATRTGITSIQQALVDTQNRSAEGISAVIDGFIQSSSSDEDLSGVVQTITSVGSKAELSDVVSQTLPLLSGNTSISLGETLGAANEVVQARVEANYGLSSGDELMDDRRAWVKPFGAWASQDDRKGVSGYDANYYGVVTGFDSLNQSDVRQGFAVAISKSDVESNSIVAPQAAKLTNFQLIAYGSGSLDSDLEYSYQADLGYSDINGTRTLPDFSRAANADYASYSVHFGSRVSRLFEHSEQDAFILSGGMDYALSKSESYTETGAGSLNHTVDSQLTRELVASIDGKYQHKIDAQNSLNLSAGLSYDLINEDISVQSSLAGGGGVFVTEGLSRPPWMVDLGIEWVHEADEGQSLVFGFDVEGQSDYRSKTVSAKYRWLF